MAYSLLAIIKGILLILVREVTLRKQAEARTKELAQREAQRRMNEFLNVASHELKTPLTSIKGNLQLMGRRLKYGIDAQMPAVQTAEAGEINATSNTNSLYELDNTRNMNNLLIETKGLLERTDKQVSHLTRLVNALLESSRLDNNELKLRAERFEMNKLVREAAQDVQYNYTKRAIHVEPYEEDLLVLADMQHVKQVVVHFLSNAHKFSSITEHIDVLLQREDGNVRVSVHDNGPGIRPDEHNKIWERFYRVPDIEVQNGSEVGLGLGLYLSRAIIEQHNGTIGLKSTPGGGSTFWFVLPLASEEGETV